MEKQRKKTCFTSSNWKMFCLVFSFSRIVSNSKTIILISRKLNSFSRLTCYLFSFSKRLFMKLNKGRALHKSAATHHHYQHQHTLSSWVLGVAFALLPSVNLEVCFWRPWLYLTLLLVYKAQFLHRSVGYLAQRGWHYWVSGKSSAVGPIFIAALVGLRE